MDRGGISKLRGSGGGGRKISLAGPVIVVVGVDKAGAMGVAGVAGVATVLLPA